MNRHQRRAAAATQRLNPPTPAGATTDAAIPALDAAMTLDGFRNILLGLGEGSHIQSGASYQAPTATLNRIMLENAYCTSWMVGAAVDAIPEDMTRAGIVINSEDPPDRQEEILESLGTMGIWDALLEGIKWGRLYGGALVYIDIEGHDPATPLRMDTVARGQFRGLATYDRWQLFPDLHQVVPSGPHRGLPMYYTLVADITTGQVTNLKMHHSRVIRFMGTAVPRWQAVLHQLWGQSIVERMLDRLTSFDTSTAGAANLVTRAHLRTIAVDGLREILGMGGKREENLLKMFKHMKSLQNNEGVTLLDAKDQFGTHSYTFAGLADIMLQFAQQIAGATGIPLVRLFGMSPAGLNATGESDMRNYYDTVNVHQENRLRDGLHRILDVMYRSMYGTPPPAGFGFSFVPLWQMSAKEKGEVAASTVTTISTAYQDGVIPASVYLRELRQMSDQTDVFTNVTSDLIEAAEAAEALANMPPPTAASIMDPAAPGAPGKVDTGLPGDPMQALVAAGNRAEAGLAPDGSDMPADPIGLLVAHADKVAGDSGGDRAALLAELEQWAAAA